MTFVYCYDIFVYYYDIFIYCHDIFVYCYDIFVSQFSSPDQLNLLCDVGKVGEI